MIKCQHTLADLDAMAKVFYREANHEFSLENDLAAWSANELSPVMLYLHNNIREIIKGRPDVLEHHVLQVQPLIDQAKINYEVNHAVIMKGTTVLNPAQRTSFITKWVKDNIRGIFNYDKNPNSFISRRKGALAYRHAKRLKINSCPYCNAQFTFTLKNKKAKTRPQFDHFLDKGRHPYLALSFYNLIPSCQICNSTGVKGSSLFSVKTHLHPFIDNMEGLYEFRTKIDAVDFLVKGEDFELLLRPIIGGSITDKKRAKKSIDSFALNDRYKFHKDYAEEILKKAYFYNKSTIEDLFHSFEVGGTSIFTSKSEIRELVMGNYMHPDNFHKRIFSKLTKDISEEFGLTI